MYFTTASGKKRLRPPSTSQEINKIHNTDSWEIPGAPDKGKNSPAINKHQISIPVAVTLTLKTEINNENQEIKLLECSTNKDKQNNPVNIPLNYDIQDESVNNKSAAPGSLNEGNSCDIVNSNSINNDQILDINLTETIPVKEIVKKGISEKLQELKESENEPINDSNSSNLPIPSEDKANSTILEHSTLYPKIEIKNVSSNSDDTQSIEENDLKILSEENPSMEDTPEYDIDENDLLTDITGLTRAEIMAEIEKIELDSDKDSISDLSDLDSSDFSSDEDEKNPPSISESGLEKIFENFEYRGDKSVEEHLLNINQTIANIDMANKIKTDEQTEVETIASGCFYLDEFDNAASAREQHKAGNIEQSFLEPDDESESRIKHKKHYFKNELSLENRVKIAKTISFLSYLHEYPNQNKLMTIIMIVLTAMLLGNYLAPYGLLTIIFLYVNIPNGRYFLQLLAERTTDIIDIDKLETNLEIKTIQSHLGVLDKIQIPVAINGSKIIFELDTGAAVNCVSENILLKVLPNYHEMELCSAYRLSSVEGKAISVIDARRLGCEFEGVGKVFLDFHVLKEKNICLLGRPFLITCNIGMQVKGQKVYIEINPNRRKVKNPFAVNIKKLELAKGEEKLIELEVKDKDPKQEHFIPHLSNMYTQIKIKYKMYSITRTGENKLAVYCENVGENPLIIKPGGFLISLLPCQPEKDKNLELKGFKAPKMGSIKSIAVLRGNNGIKEQLNKIKKGSNILSKTRDYLIKPILNIIKYVKNKVKNIVNKLLDKIPFKIVLKNV